MLMSASHRLRPGEDLRPAQHRSEAHVSRPARLVYSERRVHHRSRPQAQSATAWWARAPAKTGAPAKTAQSSGASTARGTATSNHPRSHARMRARLRDF
jgi:hypothetical protein